MSNQEQTMADEPKGGDFAERAESRSTGILGEFFHFLMQRKKWWLLPIIVALLLVGVLIILGSSAAAPFIYTLF